MQQLISRFKPMRVLLAVFVSFVLFVNPAIADANIRSNASDLLYPGANAEQTNRPDIGARQQESLPPLPNQKQPSLQRSNPDAKILERVGETFKDASAFLKETADSASDRPELKSNPARGQ